MSENNLLQDNSERENKNAVFGGQAPIQQQVTYDDVPYESVPLPSRGIIYSQDSSLHCKEMLDIKVMTAKEEDILTSRALIKRGTVITELLKSCLVDKTIDVQDMIAGDRNALMVAVRITGYGAEYPAEVQCGMCEHVYDNSFDLTKLPIKRLTIEPVSQGENLFLFKLPVSGKTVYFKFLNGRDEENMNILQERMKKLGNVKDSVITNKLKHCIVRIDGDDNKSNIARFVDTMRARDSKELRKFIDNNEPGIVMKQDVHCPACGNVEEVNMPLGAQFFWPD